MLLIFKTKNGWNLWHIVELLDKLKKFMYFNCFFDKYYWTCSFLMSGGPLKFGGEVWGQQLLAPHHKPQTTNPPPPLGKQLRAPSTGSLPLVITSAHTLGLKHMVRKRSVWDISWSLIWEWLLSPSPASPVKDDLLWSALLILLWEMWWYLEREWDRGLTYVSVWGRLQSSPQRLPFLHLYQNYL